MNIEEAVEEFSFFNEGDYITKKMSIAKDIILTAYERELVKSSELEELLENSVSKDKIKEIIKEYYEYDKRMQNRPDWHTTEYYEAKTLEKLLEE